MMTIRSFAVRWLAMAAAMLSVSGSLRAGEPLPVFILAGQSNMQGHAAESTLDHLGLDPATLGLLQQMKRPDGSATVCKHVWISSIGNDGTEKEYHGPLTIGYGAKGNQEKMGPEFTFGLTLEQTLQRPVLLIKTAWGGKSLHTDFRSPGSGVSRLSEKQIDSLKQQGKDVEQAEKERAEASGHYYRLMLDHTRRVLADIQRVYPDYDPDAGYALAGFVWFQGWNDMVASDVYPQRGEPDGYQRYSILLEQFIRDVRKDLDAPKLPFVIGVMGVGGPTSQYGPEQQRYQSIHQGFRDAMAAPADQPEFQGNVMAVRTEAYWDAELAELKDRGRKIGVRSAALRDDETLTDAERKEKIEAFRENLYTDREREILRGSSNAEYHYLGSAKIVGQIGKAFADAILQMNGWAK